MSTQQRFQDDDSTIYRPKVEPKSVVIHRSSGGGGGRSSLYGGSSMSTRTSFTRSMNPAVYAQISATGLADFRGNREKEKKEMQDCNERLATYIEKVRWLEAQNKKLEAELEALRNRKQEDWKPIRDMYEGELGQARQVISDLSSQKGVSEAKLVGLQDEIMSLREKIGLYDAQAKDYNKKIDQLNSQIGEYEGELTTLRLRCGSLEDELAKVRAMLQKYKDENARLRADLDAETTAHIEQEVLAQAKNEECQFLQELLDRLETQKEEPVRIKGLDQEAFFKSELRQSMQDMQQMYDAQLEQQIADLDMKYNAQVNQMRSGNVRDTMESEHSKSEIKKLRDQMAAKVARIAELEAMLASIKAERDNFCVQLRETEDELEKERLDSARKLTEMQTHIESLLAQLQELMDAKMSLELEIACYKKLLEGEENRSGLRQLVEMNLGIQSSGVSQLTDIIGQSNLSSSSTARTTVQRTSKGPVGFQSADPSGACVVLENTSSGARAKSQVLKGWKVKKLVNGKIVQTVDLSDKELKPGKQFKLFAKGAKSVASDDDEQICDTFSFGAGTGKYMLLDDSDAEKASLTVTQVM